MPASLLRALRYAIIFLFVGGASYLLWVWNTVPSGEFRAKWIPGQESPFIGGWGPAESLEVGIKNKDDFKVIGEVAAFTVKLPAEFKELEFKIAYDKPSAPLLLLSGKNGLGGRDVLERVLYSKFLEELSWPSRSFDNVIIYERERSERSREEFFSGSIPLQTVGMRVPRRLGKDSSKKNSWEMSLRGGHTFWLLPGDEENTELYLSVQDMNRHPSPDPVLITVEDGMRVIKKITYPDDGVKELNLPGEIRSLKVSVSAPRGPLRVKFSASDDIFIRKFSSNAARLVFEEHIFLGDDVGFGGRSVIPNIWTDGAYLTARTPHREGRQDIFFAGRLLPLKRSGEMVSVKLGINPSGILPVKVQRNDVELFTSGFFSLSPQDFFAPTWREVSWDDNAPIAGVVVGRYGSPVESSGILISEAKFDTSELLRESDGTYRFFLELPGAHENEGFVRLRSITLSARK